MEDNPLKLKPITQNKDLHDPDNINTAYMYTNTTSAHIHLRGRDLCEHFTPGSLVEVIYMDPNHLFITLTDVKSVKRNNYYTVTKITKDKYLHSLKINKLAKDLNLKPQGAKQVNSKHSGVGKEIIPYKCYKAVGWLLNIKEFQPTISI